MWGIDRKLLPCMWLILFSLTGPHSFAYGFRWKKVTLLVYTKNGAGYVHANIPAAEQMFRELSSELGFKVDIQKDPKVFTDESLKKYDAIVFASTNNDVFETDAQRVALMRFVQAGGGFVGIHSACGTERNWPWFTRLIGGKFFLDEEVQSYTARVVDPGNPSVAHLGEHWKRAGDECYYLKSLSVNLRVVAVHELNTVRISKPGRIDTFGDVFPAAWWQEFDGGRSFFTAYGHDKADYRRDDFRKHILGGIICVISGAKKKKYGRAYAQRPTDAVRGWRNREE